MPQGYRDFAAGEVLTAANLEDYCQNQGIMRFADSSARDTALSAVKTEGMLAYLLDTNTITVYSGSAWSTIGPVHNALSTWTPGVVQSGSVSATTTLAYYNRVGRMVTGLCQLAITGTGSATNIVTVSLPIAAETGGPVIGSFMIFDTSASTFYSGVAKLSSTTTVAGYGNSVTNGFGVSSFTAALASGDIVYMSFSYAAAADA